MHLDEDTFEAVLVAFHNAGGELWQGFERHVGELRAFAPVQMAMLALEEGAGDKALASARAMLEEMTV